MSEWGVYLAGIRIGSVVYMRDEPVNARWQAYSLVTTEQASPGFRTRSEATRWLMRQVRDDMLTLFGTTRA